MINFIKKFDIGGGGDFIIFKNDWAALVTPLWPICKITKTLGLLQYDLFVVSTFALRPFRTTKYRLVVTHQEKKYIMSPTNPSCCSLLATRPHFHSILTNHAGRVRPTDYQASAASRGVNPKPQVWSGRWSCCSITASFCFGFSVRESGFCPQLWPNFRPV